MDWADSAATRTSFRTWWKRRVRANEESLKVRLANKLKVRPEFIDFLLLNFILMYIIVWFILTF